MLQIDNILLARDFSQVSDQALRYALDFARRTGSTLHVFYAQVLHEDPFSAGERPEPAADLEAIRDRLSVGDNGKPLSDGQGKGIEIVEAVERDVAAAPAILNYADVHDIDVIVLGTHGRRGIRRLLLGSVAEEVVRRADQPVLTVRGIVDEQPMPDLQIGRILVPVDFSDFSREALRYARELSALYEAAIDVLHVVEEKLHPAFYVGGVQSIYDVEPEIEAKAANKLEEFVSNTAGPKTTVHRHVSFGRPAHAIAEFAENEETDLVTMSTHGQTGLERFLLGSVTEKVVRHVECPVLTVKAFGHSLLPAHELRATGEHE